MKKIITIVVLLVVALNLSNCSKIEKLQEDPNRATEGSPELLFTNIEINAFKNVSLSAALACRYLTFVNGVNSNQYYNWQRASFGTYDNLKQVSKMVEEAKISEVEVYQILAKFFNSYFIVDITRTFGDVPYSEAIKATEDIYKPVYDKQKNIYLTVLNDLKSASDALAENNEPILGDIVYNGDKLKWRKLINSYYLRVLMSLSNKTDDPDLNIISRFKEIVNNPTQYPIFESNADNADLPYYDIEDNRYPLYNNNDLQTAYYMEESFVNKLQRLKDPRLFVFADKKPNASGAETTTFSAYGGLKGSGDLNENAAKAVAGEASRIAARYYNDPENEPSILMSYWELEFILAEAAARGWIDGSPKVHYKSGIVASFKFYDITGVNNYLANPEVQLGNDNKIKKILSQKHIALFLNTGWQIFYEQRRTGYPEFDVSGSGILNGGRVPKRWMYPSSEAINNADNLAEAIDRQFPEGDNINAEMWLIK